MKKYPFANIANLPKPYSDKWLKELRSACNQETFKTAPTKHEIGNYNHAADRPYTNKELQNITAARALIEGR